MTIKLTKKDIERNYTNIIELGYCDLYHMVRQYKKVGYGSGVYGWNYDCYEINENTCIITGYRPFGNIKPDFKVIDKFNKKERNTLETISYINGDYNIRSKKLIKLMNQFIKEVL